MTKIRSEGPAAAWTGTPPTSSPPTPQALPGRPADGHPSWQRKPLGRMNSGSTPGDDHRPLLQPEREKPPPGYQHTQSAERSAHSVIWSPCSDEIVTQRRRLRFALCVGSCARGKCRAAVTAARYTRMCTQWMLACPALPGESLRGHHAPAIASCCPACISMHCSRVRKCAHLPRSGRLARDPTPCRTDVTGIGHRASCWYAGP